MLLYRPLSLSNLTVRPRRAITAAGLNRQIDWILFNFLQGEQLFMASHAAAQWLNADF